MKIRQKLVEEQLRTLVLSRPYLNPDTRAGVEEEIKLRVKDLNDIQSELSRMRTILRYRFPERAIGQSSSAEGEQEGQSQKPIKVEEITAQITLEDTLQRVYQSTLQKYDRGPASSMDSGSEVAVPQKRKPRSLEELEAPIINIGR